MTVDETDLIVIGSGPAGMSAARTAASAGAQVVMLDEQGGAGGQIYRGISRADDNRINLLGEDYRAGRALSDALISDNIRQITNATVWRLDDTGTVSFSVNAHGQSLLGRQVIIATGALERPVPLPGWTKPGAMTAGAAQILLKSAGLCTTDAVLVGSGPLLYLLALQLVRAGHPPRALIETQRVTDLGRATKHVVGALRGWRYLAKGSAMLAQIRRAGVKRFTAATDIALEGSAAIEAVSFVCRGKSERIACTNALLHQGVVPNIQITQSLGLEHVWDKHQHCFKPCLDPYGRTSLPNILVAGDGGGIIGASASVISGEIAGWAALTALGRINNEALLNKTRALQSRLQRELAIRPFLDTLYAPPGDVLTPDDKTIICRCEDITAGDIRGYAKLGCMGPNQTKAFGRPGMGPCQGRFCGLTVTNLLAQANRMTPQQVGYYRIRSPLKSITVGELADLVVPGAK